MSELDDLYAKYVGGEETKPSGLQVSTERSAKYVPVETISPVAEEEGRRRFGPAWTEKRKALTYEQMTMLARGGLQRMRDIVTSSPRLRAAVAAAARPEMAPATTAAVAGLAGVGGVPTEELAARLLPRQAIPPEQADIVGAFESVGETGLAAAASALGGAPAAALAAAASRGARGARRGGAKEGLTQAAEAALPIATMSAGGPILRAVTQAGTAAEAPLVEALGASAGALAPAALEQRPVTAPDILFAGLPWLHAAGAVAGRRAFEPRAFEKAASRAAETIRTAFKPEEGLRQGMPEDLPVEEVSAGEPVQRGLKTGFPSDRNYQGPLANYSDRMYREVGPHALEDYLPRGRTFRDMGGNVYLSNDPNLALGQGKNKGVLLEFATKGLQGQADLSKPAAEALWTDGSGEFIARFNDQGAYRSALRSVTIKPGAKVERAMQARLEGALSRLRWRRSVAEDGSVTYSKPDTTGPQVRIATGDRGSVPLNLATAGMASFMDKDVIPAAKGAAKGIGSLLRGAKAALAPRSGTPAPALDAIMEALGGRNRAQYAVQEAFSGARRYMDQMPQDAQIAFVDNFKQGKPQATSELQAIDRAMREVDTATWQEAQKYPAPPAWLENHFRVIWKVLPGAQAETFTGTIMGKRPLRGSRGMLKQHVLDTMSEGIARGGEPISYNPVEMFETAQVDLQKYVTAQRMWEWMRNHGYAKFVRSGQKPPEGYVQLDDAIAKTYFKAKSGEGMIKPGEFYVEEGVGRVLNNHLSRDYLRYVYQDTPASQFTAPLGRGLLAAKNAMTSVELGLSGFHAAFETGEAISSRFGIGARRAWNVGVRQMKPASFARGVAEMITAPLGPAEAAAVGHRVVRYLRNPEEFKALAGGRKLLGEFPEADQVIGDLFTGGGKLAMHEDYRLKAAKGLRDAWRDGNIPGALLRSPLAISELAMHPLFDWYIPRLKVGLFMKEYSLALEEHAQDIATGKMTRAQLARGTWDFVEDRLGEMNFDNLFWDRTMKTALQIMFRSITWKLGNLRAFGKAPLNQGAELVQAMKEGRAPKLTQEMAWLSGMSVLTAALGSVTSKLYSGRWPWEHSDGDTVSGYLRNTIFPVIDEKDDETRLSLPTYFKDLYSFGHAPTHYLTSGMSATISKGLEAMQNRDFYGVEVYDPDGSLTTQAAQIMAHLVPQPFSVQSFMRERERGAPVSLQVGSFVGFPKAPHYVSQTPAEEKASEIVRAKSAFVRTRGQAEKSKARREAIAAVARGEPVPTELQGVPLTERETLMLAQAARDPVLVAQVRGMDAEDALKIWATANPSERGMLREMIAAKVIRRVESHGNVDGIYTRAVEAGVLR